MKLYCRVIGPFCIQKPFALCQVNKMPIFIYTCIRSFESREVLQFFWIFTGDPASFIKWKCIKLHRCSIFLQQAVLNYFKLKFTNTANDLFITAVLSKQLCNAFIR